jgi:NitT/TauT family transport system substrate-binding protein
MMGHLVERNLARGRRPLPRVANMSGVLAFLSLVLLFAGGCGGSDHAKVTLQLNWYHDAEFVGYYVADAKGFYEAQGVEVTILEGGPDTPARDQVIHGAATFAITSFAEQRTLVADKQPVVAVMAAFQIPPHLLADRFEHQ